MIQVRNQRNRHSSKNRPGRMNQPNMQIVATGVKHSSYNEPPLLCQVNACRIKRGVMRSANTTTMGIRAEVVGSSMQVQASSQQHGESGARWQNNANGSNIPWERACRPATTWRTSRRAGL